MAMPVSFIKTRIFAAFHLQTVVYSYNIYSVFIAQKPSFIMKFIVGYYKCL